MKKFLSMLLAVVLVLSLGTVAFADGIDDYIDQNAGLPKTYTVNNGGTAPAEDFTFKFEAQKYVDPDGKEHTDATTLEAIPAIADKTIPFSTGKSDAVTLEFSIPADKYNLGVYTYKVTEVIPATKTAGVTYSNETLYLVLTILRDENNGKHYVAAMHYQSATGTDKSTGFTNTYDCGSLTVTKKITGNMADMNKKFKFTITFAAETGTKIKSVISSDSTAGTWNGLTYTIELGNGDSVTLSNIPAGTTYTVTEDPENYTCDQTDAKFSGDIAKNDADSVTFTNKLENGEIDTGITLDSMPYVVMLVVVCAGLFVVLAKKRAAREN